MEEMKSYTTFTITAKDGREVELAVVDEFRYETGSYVAAALVDGDTIDESSVYIYRVKVSEDDFTVEQITDPEEYEKVAEAYMHL